MKKVADLQKGDKCWQLRTDGTIEALCCAGIHYMDYSIYEVRFEKNKSHFINLLMDGEAVKHTHDNGCVIYLNKEDVYGAINERIKKLRLSKIQVLGD